MLRTSLRSQRQHDTIEHPVFLSSNAQDFIEETMRDMKLYISGRFLSSNAQDFIEEINSASTPSEDAKIPEQ